ncbi:MAG: cell division protein FtsQ/DivIB [Deltaproteobacteria bacterium]
MQISLPFETTKGSNKKNSYRGDPRKLQRRLRSILQLSAVCLAFIGFRIRIDIVERTPVALIKGRQFYLMDIGGVCFTSAEPGDYAGLPIITGLAPEILASGSKLPREFTVLIEDLYQVSQLQLPWRLISEIRWRKDKGLSIFTVRGGIQIDLGRDNYGSKIARLEKVLRYLDEKGLDPQLRGIDLSHGNRVFVRGNFKVHKQDRPQKKGV